MNRAIEKARLSKEIFAELVSAQEIQNKVNLKRPVTSQETRMFHRFADIFFGGTIDIIGSVAEKTSRTFSLISGAKNFIINIFRGAGRRVGKVVKFASNFIKNTTKLLTAVWLIMNNFGVTLEEFARKVYSIGFKSYHFLKDVATSMWSWIRSNTPILEVLSFVSNIFKRETHDVTLLKSLSFLKEHTLNILIAGAVKLKDVAIGWAGLILGSVSKALGLKISPPAYKIDKNFFEERKTTDIKTNYGYAYIAAQQEIEELENKRKTASASELKEIERRIAYLNRVMEYYQIKHFKYDPYYKEKLDAFIEQLKNELERNELELSPTEITSLNSFIKNESNEELIIEEETEEQKSALTKWKDEMELVIKMGETTFNNSHFQSIFTNFTGKEMKAREDSFLLTSQKMIGIYNKIISPSIIHQKNLTLSSSAAKQLDFSYATSAFDVVLKNAPIIENAKGALAKTRTELSEGENWKYERIIKQKTLDDKGGFLNLQNYFSNETFDTFVYLDKIDSEMFDALHILVQDLAKIEERTEIVPERHEIIVALRSRLENIHREFVSNRDRRRNFDPLLKLNNGRS